MNHHPPTPISPNLYPADLSRLPFHEEEVPNRPVLMTPPNMGNPLGSREEPGTLENLERPPEVRKLSLGQVPVLESLYGIPFPLIAKFEERPTSPFFDEDPGAAFTESGELGHEHAASREPNVFAISHHNNDRPLESLYPRFSTKEAPMIILPPPPRRQSKSESIGPHLDDPSCVVFRRTSNTPGFRRTKSTVTPPFDGRDPSVNTVQSILPRFTAREMDLLQTGSDDRQVPQHHHHNSSLDSVDYDTASTSSSYIEPSRMDPEVTFRGAHPPSPLQQSTNLPDRENSPSPIPRSISCSTVGDDGADDGGFRNKYFSDNLSEHEDVTLPPVGVVEDIATAPKMHTELPIIDDLVREEVVIGKEGLKALTLQIFIPFILAGLGMVAAGIILNTVQTLQVFVDISEILIMVPALLGLKGNLEMTLASRLSTQVNIGGFDDAKRKWRIIGCNVALNQVLATGVGTLAAIFAVIMYAINHGGSVEARNIFLLFGVALISACSTSVVQDSVMIGIVLLARRFRVNPDNIATPVAGTIGDTLTLGILVGFSLLFHSAFGTSYWMVGPAVTVSILGCLVPMWAFFACKELTTRHVLMHGWLPVVMAMIISSCAGVILERVVSSGKSYFKSFTDFQPLINGIGGNLVSVQASRISTYLHVGYLVPGHVPPGYTFCVSPCHTFCSRSNINARTARLLLLMIVPGHLVFLFVISFIQVSTITLRFAFVFLILALLQLMVLLYLADILTHFVWKKALDPDSTTIPYLTAMGDLSGTGLLAFGFWLLYVTSRQGEILGL